MPSLEPWELFPRLLSQSASCWVLLVGGTRWGLEGERGEKGLPFFQCQQQQPVGSILLHRPYPAISTIFPPQWECTSLASPGDRQGPSSQRFSAPPLGHFKLWGSGNITSSFCSFWEASASYTEFLGHLRAPFCSLSLPHPPGTNTPHQTPLVCNT